MLKGSGYIHYVCKSPVLRLLKLATC